MTDRPEFNEHDYFKIDPNGYISRQVLIKHVNNSYDRMREIEKYVKRYDLTFDEYMKQWNGQLEELDEDIKGLLHEWIDDGTFTDIINEELFQTKADKKELDQVTAQLAQTEYEAKRKRELEDLSPTVLSAIEGGEGTSFNLSSIPQDNSVTPKKTTFLKTSSNLFNVYKVREGKHIEGATGEPIDNQLYAISEYIEIDDKVKLSRSHTYAIHFYDSNYNWLGRVATLDETVTPLTDSRYMIATIPLAEMHEFHINEGEVLLPFERYTLELDSTPEDDLPEEVSGFFKKSNNVYNVKTSQEGYTFGANASDTTGEIVPDSLYMLSDFIPIEHLGVYQKTYVPMRVNFYDLNHRFIRNVRFKIDAPIKGIANAHYMRVSYSKSYEKVMINRGDTLLDYEEYGYELVSTDETPVKISEQFGLGGGDTTTGPVLEPYPRKITPEFTDAQFRYPFELSNDGKVMLGFLSGTMRQSLDDGETWEVIYNIPDEGTVSNIKFLNDGEILVGVRSLSNPDVAGHMIKSKGYSRENPTGATWEKVLEFEPGNVYASTWSVDVVENIVVVAEYGQESLARHAYLSKDYGETFKLIFELHVHEDAHLHGICYDPWFDRIYLSNGDGVNSAIRYSDDEGETWTVISRDYQPTPMLAMESGIIMGTDTFANGVLRIPRTRKEDTPYVVSAFPVETQDTMRVIGQQIYKRNGPNFPALISFSRNLEGPSIVVATLDGKNFYEIFRDTQLLMNNNDGFRSFVGPTESGKLIGVQKDDRGWAMTKVVADAPKWVMQE